MRTTSGSVCALENAVPDEDFATECRPRVALLGPHSRNRRPRLTLNTRNCLNTSAILFGIPPGGLG